MSDNILNKRWKTIECISGKDCWCLPVVTEDYDKTKDDYIIGVGAVSKEMAEHIVKIHNDYLLTI